MRSVRVLAASVTFIMVLSCLIVPLSTVSFAVDPEPTPDDYIDFSQHIKLTGYVSLFGYDETNPPLVYIFITHDGTDNDVYTNASEGTRTEPMISTKITIDTKYSTEEETYYKFEATVPLAKVSSSYYLYVFNTAKIRAVSSKYFEDSAKTISPDSTCPQSYTRTFTAWKILYPAWEGAVDGDTKYVSGETPFVDTIGLASARGSITGHVSGTIGNSTEDLDDVRVELKRNGETIADTRSNSKGVYTFTGIPTGDYILEFSRGNYHCNPISITVEDEKDVTPADAEMILDSDTSYYGYDLIHFLMFVAIGVCVVIILVTILFQYRRIKHKGREHEWILDDMPEEER